MNTSHVSDATKGTGALATRCCVVGAGPAGALLALLLARAGIDVTLIEAMNDFDRDFRGDTIHPSTLEVLDQIGLAGRLHELPHGKISSFRLISDSSAFTLGDFRRLPTPFPYIMIMAQSRFLEFLIEEAKRYSHFHLRMGAHATRLIEENGVVVGVGIRDKDGEGEVRATLTVAADGRFSRLRKLSGFEPVASSEPLEVLWFRVPRLPGDDPGEIGLHVGRRGVVVVLGRETEWQVGLSTSRGGYHQFKEEGIAAFHASVRQSLPWLDDRLDTIKSWDDLHLLSVQGSRLETWHKPGLLLIGDAAHVMLPIGGVGINCAIADAVETANVLSEPLRSGRVEEAQLAEVQRRRVNLTKMIQSFQTRMQRNILGVIDSGKPFKPPLPLRLILLVPGLRDVQARVAAFGIKRVRIERPQERAA